jgi:CTP synthase
MSLIEALKSAAWAQGRSLDLWWVNAEQIESGKFSVEELQHAAGIVVPGGFGTRGTEGKIRAIRFAREKRIPFLGLCFGMQLMAIETARNLAKIPGATSEEFAPHQGEGRREQPTPFVIHLMEEQKKTLLKGGTMRLGAWPCTLKDGSLARRLRRRRGLARGRRPASQRSPWAGTAAPPGARPPRPSHVM